MNLSFPFHTLPTSPDHMIVMFTLPKADEALNVEVMSKATLLNILNVSSVPQ